MATFGLLRTRITQKISQDYLNEAATGAPESLVGQAINDAVEYYSRMNFWFNTGYNTSTTLTVGDPLLTAPSDLLYIKNLDVLDGNKSYSISKISNEEYSAMDAQATGRPFAYTQIGDEFYLYFYPDRALQVQLTYIKSYPAMSNDSDFNDFTVNAPQLIEAHALMELYLDARHSDGTPSTLRASYEQKTAMHLRNIQLVNRQRTTTGRVAVSSMLTN
jgi:hypothetical protein